MYVSHTRTGARRAHAPGYLGALLAGLRAAWRALSNSNYKTVK